MNMEKLSDVFAAEFYKLKQFCTANAIEWRWWRAPFTLNNYVIFQFMYLPTNRYLSYGASNSWFETVTDRACLQNEIISFLNAKLDYLSEEKRTFYMNKDFTVKDRHLVANDIYTKYCENDVIATNEAYMTNFNDKRKPEIEKVIFSGPCTIVLWSDGDKTMVRCENESFDKEKGLAMAISKKFLGSNKSKSNYYDVFEKWIPEEEAEEEVSYYSVQEFAKMIRVSESTVLRYLRNGKIFGARKENGKWVIPFPS